MYEISTIERSARRTLCPDKFRDIISHDGDNRCSIKATVVVFLYVNFFCGCAWVILYYTRPHQISAGNMFKKIKNHIFTLHEKVELLVLYGVMMFFLGIWLNHIITSEPEQKQQTEETLPSNSEEMDTVSLLEELEDNNLEQFEEITSPEVPNYSEYIHEITVKKGDNFTNLLVKAGMDRKETFFAARALSKKFDLRNLRAGQKMTAIFREKIRDDNSEEGELEFVLLRITEADKEIELIRNDDGSFSVQENERQLNKHLMRSKGEIKNSLAHLAAKLDVPPNILNEVVRAYSYDIDFQRDIRKGNRFEILYEVYFDENGEKVREGGMLYAMLTVRGEDLRIYHFSPSGEEDDYDYFTEEGRSLRRSLMRTPINGAIISSPFGIRVHPISGYTRVHKGIDFAAPMGTPFYAAGDGTIDFIGAHGGHGNYIRIKHNSEYSTAYGHISRYAKGMRKGRKVKQGQIIAYVGSTGVSTGPHLHYEILKNDKHINPSNSEIPPGRKLKGADLEKFKLQKQDIDSLFASTPAKEDL